MRSDVVRLFQTLPHTCGYYAERTAQNLVIDPSSPQLDHLYEIALSRGYRRAGGHVYIPRCLECRACIACRIPVAEFAADRSQRRCNKRNADLEIRVEPARYTDEGFDLYQRYLKWRHPDGGMDDAQADDFSRFLYTHWSPTRFVEFREKNRLLAIAVTDFCRSGLSAVYTFYDPSAGDRSLGTFAILQQIALAQLHKLDHLYLGFWINGHPKMDYKMRFKSVEILENGVWKKRLAENESTEPADD